MNFTLVVILLAVTIAIAVLIMILPDIRSKIQIGVGVLLGWVFGGIIVKLWKEREGGEIDKAKAELKKQETEVQRVFNEVADDIQNMDTDPALDIDKLNANTKQPLPEPKQDITTLEEDLENELADILGERL
jgi:peptidoglycan hydrolase CwlO-like protein